MKNFTIIALSAILFLSCSKPNVQELLKKAEKETQEKKWEDAHKTLQGCLPHAAEYPQTHVLYSIVLSNRKPKQIEKAIEHMNKAIKVSPKKSIYHFFLGELYFEKANYPKARKSLEEALALNPGDNQALILLVKCDFAAYTSLTDQTEVYTKSKYLEKLFKSKTLNTNHATLVILANKQFINWQKNGSRGFPIKAVRAINNARKIKETPEVILNYAIIYDMAKRKNNALKYYNQYKKMIHNTTTQTSLLTEVNMRIDVLEQN